MSVGPTIMYTPNIIDFKTAFLSVSLYCSDIIFSLMLDFSHYHITSYMCCTTKYSEWLLNSFR